MEDEGSPLKDDPSIADETIVLRRIPSKRYKLDRNGKKLPNSDNFKDDPSDNGCSVDVMIDDAQPTRTMQGHEGFGLVGIQVGFLRSLGLGIAWSDEPGNPAHALFFGERSKRARKRIAEMADWIVEPFD